MNIRMAALFIIAAEVFLQPSAVAGTLAGQCRLIPAQNGEVKEIQCREVPDGAIRYLNDFLHKLEQNRGASRLSRGMWIKLGQDWSRKFIDTKDLLHHVSGRDPIASRIESLLVEGQFSKAGELIDSSLVPDKGPSSFQALLNYVRAKIFDLQFQSAASLPHYQKAYENEKLNARYSLSYGLKLLDQGNLGPAQEIFEGALKRIQDNPATQDYQQQYHRASLLLNLGLINKKNQNVEEALQFYREALERFQAMETRGGFDNRFEIAVTLDNLGNLLQETRQFNGALEVHTQALNIFRTLAGEQPEAYKEDLAVGLSNLGNLLGTIQKPDEARPLMMESLEIFRELAQSEASIYQFKLAIMLDNTGVMFKRMGNLTEAEKAHKEALDVYARLKEAGNPAYSADYAITLANLAAVYEIQKKYDEMVAALEEAAEIFRELSKQNTMAHMPSLAMIYLNLGDFYSDIKNDSARARELFTKALGLYHFLAKFNPNQFERYVRITQKKLGALNADTSPATSGKP